MRSVIPFRLPAVSTLCVLHSEMTMRLWTELTHVVGSVHRYRTFPDPAANSNIRHEIWIDGEE